MNTLQPLNLVFLGVIASLLTGLGTGAGALPIFFTTKISRTVLDSMLGFAAGVMLAATSFSLIVPAIEYGGGGVYGAAICLIGILAGGLFLDLTDKYFPDVNLLQGPDQGQNQRMKKIWLFTVAITVHNFPEGLAVGVGFGNGDIANGISLTIAIGLQNLPEGLAVALPFLREGFSSWKAFLIALATGMVEPVGGSLGAGLVQVARSLLPFCLAFAAGAMLFVIGYEIIPETQKGIASKLATHAMLMGFVIMMFLDNVLG